MIKETTIVCMLIIIIGAKHLPGEDKIVEEIKLFLHKGLLSSIENYISTLLETVFINMKTKVKQQTIEDNLTSTMIVEALYNLRDVMPGRIPMVPFAVAEPTTNNMLVYFSILDSFFVNLNQFCADATVSNTNSSTFVALNLHINKSSLEGRYELDICNYDIHLYGDGNYSIISNNTDVTIATDVQIFQDNSFLMSDFFVNISISSAQIMMSNFLGGDPSVQPMFDAIEQLVPAEVATLNLLIQDTVNQSVVDFTNSVLAKIVSWDDIVWVIREAGQC